MALTTTDGDSSISLNVDFDAEEDVLYVCVGQPVSSHADEAPHGVLLRWSNVDNSPSGVTVVDFLKKWRDRRSEFYFLVAKHLPVPVQTIKRDIERVI
jgi:hypothetical protein